MISAFENGRAMFFKSLSGRFLLLTIIFVMLAEILIFLPSLATFRLEYLRERLDRAQIASLAIQVSADLMVKQELEQKLLAKAGVLNVVFRRQSHRELVLQSPNTPPVKAEYDLSETTMVGSIIDAITVLNVGSERIVHVIGPPAPNTGVRIEIALDETDLRDRLLYFGFRVFLISMIISLFTATLLFLAVRYFITRPIVAVVDNMARFRENPENPDLVIQPTSGTRELAEAEQALQEMQSGLVLALRQKDRLAALGGAVARISHDLRNMLTTAQLFADRLDMSQDPKVSRVAPKLVAALDRAITLCQQTLDFGKSEEPLPERRLVDLNRLAEEIAESELLHCIGGRIKIHNTVPEGLTVEADPEQMYRVLSNLVRNARQALEQDGRGGEILIHATSGSEQVRIEIADTGPGLPIKARENLFMPFSGRGRPGGSGLGLAISAELVAAHGGTLELVESTTRGSRFAVLLPGRTDASQIGGTTNISPLRPPDRAARHLPNPRR